MRKTCTVETTMILCDLCGVDADLVEVIPIAWKADRLVKSDYERCTNHICKECVEGIVQLAKELGTTNE